MSRIPTRSRRVLFTLARMALRGGAVAALWMTGAFAAAQTHAAPPPDPVGRSADFGMTYTQERSKFVGSADSDYFYLRGATLDYSEQFWHGFGASVSGTGLAASNLQTNIDIHHIQVMVGPRYTYNLGHITPTAWNRKGSAFVEGKVGYTFATSGLYPVNGVVMPTASALTYAGGAGLNLHIYHRFEVRLIEADYVVTKLPNGTTNQQNTLRFASGLNFHFGL